jgi:actin-related protein
MSQGKVIDWDKAEGFWRKIICEDMSQDLTEKAVITNFYPHTDKFSKEKSLNVFFESFQVPLYFSVCNSLLVLYASGKVNGIIVDSGEGLTSAVPISDGSIMNFSQTTDDLAGDYLTKILCQELQKTSKEQTQANPGMMNYLFAKDLKEKYLRVSMNYEKDLKELKKPKIQSMANTLSEGGNNSTMVTLPDGSALQLGNLSVKVPETLFRPETFGLTNPGVHEVIYDCILKNDLDVRRQLCNNIIITGGNTLFSNYNERLQRELGYLLPSILNVRCLSVSNRLYAQWLGGAIVSALSIFQPMWITRAEYDECGPSVIHRKSI